MGEEICHITPRYYDYKINYETEDNQFLMIMMNLLDKWSLGNWLQHRLHCSSTERCNNKNYTAYSGHYGDIKGFEIKIIDKK